MCIHIDIYMSVQSSLPTRTFVYKHHGQTEISNVNEFPTHTELTTSVELAQKYN